VEALVAGRPDVHRGAQADSLQTLQNLDVVPGVRALQGRSLTNSSGGNSGGKGDFFGGHATPNGKALRAALGAKRPIGNNILKVQGLPTLDSIQFSTFRGPISSVQGGSRRAAGELPVADSLNESRYLGDHFTSLGGC
jgi:hypothetical protein